MYVKFRLVKLRERKATKYYSDFNILYNGRNIKNDRHTNTLFRKFHYAYQGAIDAIHTRDSSDNVGHRMILSFSFVSGSRQMYQLYQDAMAIVSHFEKLNLF